MVHIFYLLNDNAVPKKTRYQADQIEPFPLIKVFLLKYFGNPLEILKR